MSDDVYILSDRLYCTHSTRKSVSLTSLELCVKTEFGVLATRSTRHFGLFHSADFSHFSENTSRQCTTMGLSVL